MYDVIIIGAGMAGLTAAIYTKRAGKSVLIIENKVCGGQIVNSLMIGNWPGESKISGTDLMKRIQQQAIKLGTEIRYEEVISIEESAEFATTNDAKNAVRKLWSVKTDEMEYMAKTIIITTGTEPRKINANQAKSAGKRPISYCATCDGALYKNKPVVVIGSGNTAKHEIKYLENIASKVYHIHHDELIPEEAEAVFVAIGRVPATGMCKNLLDLDENGYIIAGEDCKTSRPGIFVAGDCRTKNVRQLVTAAADGAAAAGAVIDFLT